MIVIWIMKRRKMCRLSKRMKYANTTGKANANMGGKETTFAL